MSVCPAVLTGPGRSCPSLLSRPGTVTVTIGCPELPRRKGWMKGTVSPHGSRLRRRIPGRPGRKNSAVETVPTPDKNPLKITSFEKRSHLLWIKPCSLAGRENAQKFYSLPIVCGIRGLPARAMGEIFTQIMGGEETPHQVSGKNRGIGQSEAPVRVRTRDLAGDHPPGSLWSDGRRGPAVDAASAAHCVCRNQMVQGKKPGRQ